MNSNYLKTIYNTEKKPITKYIYQLVEYLVKRYSITKDQKILDLGCGRGDLLNVFNSLGFDIYGADIAKSNIEVSSENIQYFDFNTETYKYPDNMFDVIYSKSVIEHISNTDHFIKEQIRILKPGGMLILLTPDWNSQMNIFYNDYTHIRPYTQKGLNNLLESYDFKEVNTEKFYQYPLYWKYPFMKIIPNILSILGPVRRIHRNKFYRFTRESMLLASCKK